MRRTERAPVMPCPPVICSILPSRETPFRVHLFPRETPDWSPRGGDELPYLGFSGAARQVYRHRVGGGATTHREPTMAFDIRLTSCQTDHLLSETDPSRSVSWMFSQPDL
ncbi:unnamed protein product [Boreogadus saida]